MNHQIGIAANRRREVRVLGQRQAEVTDVFRLIHRLRHGADHDRLDQMRLFVPDRSLQHCAQVGRFDVPIGRQLNVEALQELT